MLTKKQILEAQDRQIEVVLVPEWGGEVFVRNITGYERDAIEASVAGTEGKADLRNYRAKVLSRAICDPEGKRVFDDEDVVALGNKSGLVLNRIYEVAQRLNGMRAEDVEETAKNSSSDQSEDSGSSSLTDTVEQSPNSNG